MKLFRKKACLHIVRQARVRLFVQRLKFIRGIIWHECHNVRDLAANDTAKSIERTGSDSLAAAQPLDRVRQNAVLIY